MEQEPRPCAAVKGTQIMVTHFSFVFWYISHMLKSFQSYIYLWFYNHFLGFRSMAGGDFIWSNITGFNFSNCIFQVENLFYNMIARRKNLQNSNDDYPKVVDLISRFAIHYMNVSFSCRKVSYSWWQNTTQVYCCSWIWDSNNFVVLSQHGANRADVHTVAAFSRLEAVRNVYGVNVARDLLEITVSDDNPACSVFNMDGFVSNANYAAKKTTMVLFINGMATGF